RHLFIFPAKPEIHRHARSQTPVVLSEESKIDRRELKGRRTESLVVAGIARDGRGNGTAYRLGKVVHGSDIVADVFDAIVVAIRPGLLEKIVVQIVEADDISAEFEHVLSTAHGISVRELVTGFVRKSAPV